MSRSFIALAFVIGCGTPNAPDEPKSDCPPATDPCMNQEAHAACLEMAAKCPGKVAQLESCPLQFACGE